MPHWPALRGCIWKNKKLAEQKSYCSCCLVALIHSFYSIIIITIVVVLTDVDRKA